MDRVGVLSDVRAHMEEQTIYRECTGECCPRHCHVVAVEVRGFAPISIFKEFVLFFFGWVRYLIFFIVVNIFLGKKFFPQKILTTIEGIWNPFAQSNFWFANLNWTPLVFLKPAAVTKPSSTPMRIMSRWASSRLPLAPRRSRSRAYGGAGWGV